MAFRLLGAPSRKRAEHRGKPFRPEKPFHQIIGHQSIELAHRDGASTGRLEIEGQTFVICWTGRSRTRNKGPPCRNKLPKHLVRFISANVGFVHEVRRVQVGRKALLSVEF
jgi:hypothetical protein